MENETTNSNKTAYPDRINLTVDQSKRVEAWQSQISKAFDGAVKLNRSELVNFMLDQFEVELGRARLLKLFNNQFDEMKFFAWARPRIIEAKKHGESLTVESLRQKLLSQVSITETSQVKKLGGGKRAARASKVDEAKLSPPDVENGNP